MSRTRVKSTDRFLAILLSVLMVFAMLPMTSLTAFAATTENTNPYTVTVNDVDGAAIDGATIKLYKKYSEDVVLDLSATTDANGKAAIDNSDIAKILGQAGLKSGTATLTVSKEGYVTQQIETNVNANEAYHRDVKLAKEEASTATISVKVTGDATVEVNGAEQNSATVTVGTEVTVKITPASGSYIKTLTVGGQNVEVTKGEAYEGTITVEKNVAIDATVVKEVTVTAKAGEGGSLLINDVKADTTKVDAGTQVKITAKADEGYQIESLTIGGKKISDVSGKTEFTSENIDVSTDIEVTATFVKVYTITVTHNENGNVKILEPATAGGKVTVVTGTDVKISATPEINYKVSKVVVNDQEQKDVSGNNDSGYEKTLTADKDYTVVITFAPNTFNVTETQTENGSISIGSDTVDYNGSSEITVTPDNGYAVTSVKVNDSDIDKYETENGAVKFTIENITEDKNIVATFAKIQQADVDIKTLFDDESAIRSNGMTYVYKNDGTVTFSTDKDGIILYDKDGKVIGGGSNVKSATLNKTTEIAKIELVYQDDAEMAVMAHEVKALSTSPLKIVIDTTKTESTLIPNAANENGYYNSNITFAVKAEDKGDFSGIALVEYWITLNDVQGQPIKLYEYVNGAEKKAVHEDTIDVSASTYNSKNVKVTLRVLDLAGNEEIVEKEIKINSTKPGVSLAIDGTQYDNAQKGYYNDKRELTITINDREDTFSQANVAKGLKIRKDGHPIDVATTDITWKHTEGSNQYEGKYVFADDAHYEWSFSYTNIAGLTNDGVTIGADSKDVYDFYVDKAEPHDIKITYNPDFVGVLLNTITFGFYRQDSIDVVVEAIDDTAGIEQFEYTYGDVTGTISGKDITRDGNKATAKFSVPAQFRGSVSVKAIDRAGRSVKLSDNKVVVVDTIAPGVTVTWSPAQGYNGKYFNTDRTATIKIDEANFFAQDVEDGLLYITAKVVSNDGTTKNEVYKPEFKLEDGKYVATITFSDEADYTFDVKYTDRAGNIYDEYPAEEFTIDKTAPVVTVEYNNNSATNDKYFKAARKATITVVEHNFDETAMDVLVDGKPVSVEWKKDDSVADTYVAEYTFTGDAHYVFDVKGLDHANNASDAAKAAEGSVAPWDFTVDTSGPVDLKISYEPKFVGTLLEGLTFGFYKAPVTVKIEATDDITGIDHFVYSYAVQEGASNTNVGKLNQTVTATRDGNTNRWYTSFEIPAQFRGFVSFTATNKAGVSSDKADPNAVVVDSIAPGVDVVYSNNNALNDKYYKADRTATIRINEANFFEKDIADGQLVITVEKTLNDGTYSSTNVAPKFIKNGDVYTATIDFNENADYTLDIKYTDRAGNVYDSYKKDIFTVDKIAPEISIEEADGAYFNADRTAKIKVVEHNFRASDFEFTATADDVVTGDPTVDLSSKDYTNYLKDQDNWHKVAADTWEAEITFDIEGNYVIGATYSDPAGNAQVEAISDTFCVDKTDPDNLKITYEPTVVGVLLENITFGFYKAPVKVTIEATDDIAGVDHFVYSYAVQEGASDTNVGKLNQTVTATRDGNTNRWYTSFEIPAQFRGFVSFTAYDKATNDAYLADANAVVVDNVAPGISVEYQNVNDYDKGYFNAQRKAVIKIKEANFFAQDIEDGHLVITVEKTTDDGKYTSTAMSPTFTKNGDVYTAEIEFIEDGDYTFDIKYTDRSGNVYDSYEKDEFTVDMTAPVVNVTYDNNSAKNSNQFKADRTATIQIVEHNFDATKVVAKVMASGTEVTSYAEYLAKADSWTKVEGKADTWQAVIEYTDEAHYTFEISCTDKAGNINSSVDYTGQVAPTAFTLDKSVPTEMDIKIGEKSILGSMDTHAFDTFYGKTVVVKLSANCDISGLESFKYQKVADVSEYAENGAWTDYNAETGITVEPSEKFVIYFRAEDRAGNVKIVRSTGVVVDNQKPVGETNAPEIDILPEKPNANGIHKDDVSVDLKVVDPRYAGANAADNGYYSGLNKITYKIYTTDTDAVEEGILFDLASKTKGAVFDADNLVSSWTGNITIDSEKFNSNNVIVEVDAVDNAGNERKTTTTAGQIKIDITAPTIVVSYDNNVADSDSFFKADRTATVVVTERNFNAKEVVVGITNTDGTVPTISDFTKTAGTGNGDDTIWTATIKYTADGDYKFDIAYTDLAGNACAGETFAEGTVASNEFTIDQTAPVIAVTYDNNDVQNSNYYKAYRTATVVITEHNFNAERVIITNTATDDGLETTKPTVSGWTTNGDKHTATISYSKDAKYTFDIAMNDKAGNASAEYTEETFFVDATMPSLEITGVADNSANNGDVIPVVTYSDTNYDADKVTITLTGANRKTVELDGAYADFHNGRTFTFKNFAEEKEIDDIYTLTAAITDKAGNTTEKTINFSVNRFGSTYAISEAAEKLNGTYVQKPVDVVVTETNANELKNIKITLFKNNETIVLTEGTDYKIDVTGGNGNWYHYTYTVFAKNFADDGVYRLTFHSEDAAGNVAENTLDTKDTEISFGVDATKPNIVVANLENGVTYALENMTVNMSISDNLLLSSITVYLDDYNTPYKTWTTEEIESIIAGNGEFTFDIAGDSTSAHKVKIVSVDAAGNEQVKEITDFFVTTNIWVRYYNNKGLFFGSIGGVILLAGLIVFLVVWKKKKISK